MTATLYFYIGTGFISRLIQLRSFSRFSHVSIGIDGRVYEAHYDKGVTMSPSPTTYNTAEYEEISIEITKHQRDNIIEFLDRQVGKKYDFVAIFNFLARENNRNDIGKWFCSELASIALWAGGIMDKPESLIMPGDLYKILKYQIKRI